MDVNSNSPAPTMLVRKRARVQILFYLLIGGEQGLKDLMVTT
jgi:hypothetical protein